MASGPARPQVGAHRLPRVDMCAPLGLHFPAAGGRSPVTHGPSSPCPAPAATVLLLRELDRQARKEGGAVWMLNGNHESLNIAGDFRCAARPGRRQGLCARCPSVLEECKGDGAERAGAGWERRRTASRRALLGRGSVGRAARRRIESLQGRSPASAQFPGRQLLRCCAGGDAVKVKLYTRRAVLRCADM